MTTGVYNGTNTKVSGAFTFNKTSQNPNLSGGGAAIGATINFDASRSSSCYGNYENVNPLYISCLCYICY